MNFPLEHPIFQFFYLLVNTHGVGSLFAALAGGGSLLYYFLTLRRIRSAKGDGGPTYTFPTPALHQHEEE